MAMRLNALAVVIGGLTGTFAADMACKGDLVCVTKTHRAVIPVTVEAQPLSGYVVMPSGVMLEAGQSLTFCVRVLHHSPVSKQPRFMVKVGGTYHKVKKYRQRGWDVRRGQGFVGVETVEDGFLVRVNAGACDDREVATKEPEPATEPKVASSKSLTTPTVVEEDATEQEEESSEPTESLTTPTAVEEDVIEQEEESSEPSNSLTTPTAFKEDVTEQEEKSSEPNKSGEQAIPDKMSKKTWLTVGVVLALVLVVTCAALWWRCAPPPEMEPHIMMQLQRMA